MSKTRAEHKRGIVNFLTTQGVDPATADLCYDVAMNASEAAIKSFTGQLSLLEGQEYMLAFVIGTRMLEASMVLASSEAEKMIKAKMKGN